MRTCIKHTVYLCVLYGFENKLRLFHYTALIGWFGTARRTVSLQSISSSQQQAARPAPCWLPANNNSYTANISHVPTGLQLHSTRLNVF
jgi:hypothetical protein